MDDTDKEATPTRILKVSVLILETLVAVLAVAAAVLQIVKADQFKCCAEIVVISSLIASQSSMLHGLLKRHRFALDLSTALMIAIMVPTALFLGENIEPDSTKDYTLRASTCGARDDPGCCKNVSRLYELECDYGMWTIPLEAVRQGDNITTIEAIKTVKDVWTTAPAEGVLENEIDEILRLLPPCSASQSRSKYLQVHHPDLLTFLSLYIALEGLTILIIILRSVHNYNNDDVDFRCCNRFSILLLAAVACLGIVYFPFILKPESHCPNSAANSSLSATIVKDLHRMSRSLGSLDCCPAEVSLESNCNLQQHVTAAFESDQLLTLCCKNVLLDIQFNPGGISKQCNTTCDRHVDGRAFLGRNWYQVVPTVLTMWALEILCVVVCILWLTNTLGLTGEFNLPMYVSRADVLSVHIVRMEE